MFGPEPVCLITNQTVCTVRKESPHVLPTNETAAAPFLPAPLLPGMPVLPPLPLCATALLPGRRPAAPAPAAGNDP
jgi:hypothetical protein